jgi:hypothetical protein
MDMQIDVHAITTFLSIHVGRFKLIIHEHRLLARTLSPGRTRLVSQTVNNYIT